MFSNNTKKEISNTTNVWIVIMIAVSLYATGCSKSLEAPQQVASPSTTDIVIRKEVPQLQASRSAITLLEGNAKNIALDFEWASYNNNGYGEQYTLEAAVAGTSFADPVSLVNTSQVKTSFDVQSLNNELRRVVIADVQSRIEFRVKISSQSAVVYSKPIAVEITTYQPYRKVADVEAIRIPGNYQGWKIAGASQIVSIHENGEFEGFINFTNPNTEFMMLKGTDKWESLRTFSDIGAGKFGFGGKVFMPKEGAGIYRFHANYNTNTWSLTKVNFWSLTGSAVNGKSQMEFDPKSKTWSAVVNLTAGEFVFNADNENKLKMGHNPEEGVGTLTCGSGNKIQVSKAGTYKVVLSVLTAGNYHYGLQRM